MWTERDWDKKKQKQNEVNMSVTNNTAMKTIRNVSLFLFVSAIKTVWLFFPHDLNITSLWMLEQTVAIKERVWERVSSVFKNTQVFQFSRAAAEVPLQTQREGRAKEQTHLFSGCNQVNGLQAGQRLSSLVDVLHNWQNQKQTRDTP